jgi:predicted permease
MPAGARLRSLWRNLVHRDRVDRDLDDELDSFVDLLADEQRGTGKTEVEAKRRAVLLLGGRQQVKEHVLAARTGASIETLWQDLRIGCRLLRRSPSFTAAAIVSLALGAGANSAIFGLLDALRLRSLPVERPEELAEVRLTGPRCCRHTGRNRQLSVPLWRVLAQHQQAFSHLFAFADTRFNLAPQGEVHYVEGLFVSGGFFPVLGVEAALGRTLTAADDRPGCSSPGAVISHALWQSRFEGRADILTQTLRLRSGQHPIVGVMPASFFGVEVGRRFEVALPICASGFDRPDHWWLAVMGRLKPGWTPAQASQHLATLGPSLLRAAVPPNYDAEGARQFEALPVSVVPAGNGVSPLRTQYEEPLRLLFAIAGLVLVIAAANVASLSLVRMTAREPEFALRSALGASTARLGRQLLIEGMLISLGGAAAGLMLAQAANQAILALLSTQTDRIVLETPLDARALAFGLGMVTLTTVAFTLAPLLRVARRPMPPAGSRATDPRRRVISREMLVGVQIAMSVVLVSGAMLFILTSINLLRSDTGFNGDGVLVANVFLQEGSHPPAARAAVQRDLTAKFAAIPGIVGVAHNTTPPLVGASWGTVVRATGPAGEIKGEAIRNQVSAGYFTTMRLPVLTGRDFTEADTPTSPAIAVVNQAFARKFFGDLQPLGRSFAEGGQIFTIVGLAGNAKQYTLREEFQPILYTAASQAKEGPLTIRFVLRSQVAMGTAMDAVRRVMAEAVPTAGVRFSTFDDLIEGSAQRERLMAILSGLFGATALTLASIGVYGVVAFAAASRRREIGIRLALGARAADVARTLLARVLVVTGVGAAVGALIALAAGRFAVSFLYDVELSDPAVVSLVAAMLIAAGAIAAFVPTRRAMRTDPVVALKVE